MSLCTNPMEPASTSLGQPEPAASPEPSSTRPNPFDDSDVCSRKRRRTSTSGSPTETVQPVDLAASSGTLDASNIVSDSNMILDNDPAPSRTPEQHPASWSSLDEPPTSSRVTINLRNAPYSDSTSPPTVPSLSPSLEADASVPEADSIKKSVEDPELDMAEGLDAALGISRPSSPASASPPIEVVTEDEHDEVVDEDDMTLDPSKVDLAIVSGDVAFRDPTPQFPYRDPEDTLLETVHRLIQYIEKSPIEASVLDQLQLWFDVYLKFAKHTSPAAVLHSCRVHRNFWLVLPGIFKAMTDRKASLVKSPVLRPIVAELYCSFTELTARFIVIDRFAIHQWQSEVGQSDACGPSLLSSGYLHQLHVLTKRRDLPPDHDSTEAHAEDWARSDQTSYFVSQLQSNPGGTIQSQGKLATALIEVIPTFPRLADNLAPVLQVLTDCLRESYRIMRVGQQGLSRSRQRLKVGHELWRTIASFLNATTEKQVAYLSSDGDSCEIQALAEMLKMCLHNNHDDAAAVLSEHRRNHPYLAPAFTPEAVALEWELDILGKLIRSSQMQLRVKAASSMCSSLVSIWQRLSDSSDATAAFLEHLGGYLLQTNLIDYILGPSCHPEIILESANIVGFLIVTKLYQVEHTDRLWQGITASQDPRVADALTRMITSIANLFDYRGLLDLCERLQTLPIEGFNPAVRLLWDSILRQLVARSRIEQTTLSFLPYDLCLRLLRESSVCASGSQVAYPEMQKAVMERFRGLLAHGPDPEGRRALYVSCIQDVAAKSPTTLGSLWCLYMAMRPAMPDELRVLTEQYDLVRLIVEELEHAIQAGEAADAPAVLSGSTNQPRRDFVTNVIQFQPEALDNELGERLWDVLVGPRSSCPDDRKSGWQIIMTIMRKPAVENPFLMTCFSHYLPNLPSSCFNRGMLEFVMERVRWLVNENIDCALDEEAFVANSNIEHLWRIILGADDAVIVELAIRTLAIDVYLESRTITAYPFTRARNAHLSLVTRCLTQLKNAANRIKAYSDGTSSGEDEPMVIVATDEEMRHEERVFTRSLQVLRFFMEAHYSKPDFSAPDLRSIIFHEPGQVEGDLTQLKYQSFDGGDRTAVKPLRIGKLNTAASLLASLRRETGFENYRVFYRGHQFLPTDEEICKSLEDLRVDEGLILVKREEGGVSSSVRVKPGSSPLEIEILSHFQELWAYLSMDDKIAKEIYNLLVRLPADGHIIDLFESETTSHKDVFPSGQPFKSLYAIHALVEYTEATRLAASHDSYGIRYRGFSQTSYEEALSKSLSLVVHAISDQELVDRINTRLQIQLIGALMQTFVRLLEDARAAARLSDTDKPAAPSADRLVEILSTAASATEEASVPLIANSLSAILRLGLSESQFWEDTASNPGFSEIVQNLIIFDPRRTVREHVSKLVKDVVDAEDQIASVTVTGSSGSTSHALTRYFWWIASTALAQVTKIPSQCQEFFGLFHFLLLKVANRVPAEVELDKLAEQTSNLLVRHTSTERIDQVDPFDPVARGLVSLLHLCMQMEETFPVTTLLPRSLAHDLFWRHLFPRSRTQSGQPVPRVLLNTDTRSKLCEVIFRLVRRDKDKVFMILKSLNSLVPYFTDDYEDPYVYELPCQFERSKALRSPCGYVGLRNLSNTCYLNSLFTQLFMNTQFRRFVMKCQVLDPPDSQQLLFETKKLFGYMQESYRRYVDPTNVVGTIKTYEDTVIDIQSQMDVDEFYNLLFDRWESQMVSVDEKKKLRSFYGGQLVQQVKSQECDHISERLEPFSAIQCDIKGKGSLQESLQAYVDGEIMEGDNKYKCSTCDRHVAAVKRTCLKDIPDHLIFHLKRFDFNLRSLQRSKINDYFSFPPTIDMRPYTIQHLSDAPAEEEGDDIFELVGVLVHSGTAESGHYYSYIRERPSSPGRPSWIEFNDEIVTPWDPSLMERSTFGGPDDGSGYENNGIPYNKNYSAYMLFYQRRSKLAEEQQAICAQNIPAPLRVEAGTLLTEHIHDENTLIMRRHCLFDPSHSTFVQNCFNQCRFLEGASPVLDRAQDADENVDGDADQEQPHDLKSMAMEVTMSHFDQVVTRTKDIPHFPFFSMIIRSAVLDCHRCALAYVDFFHTRHAAFRTMLQRNPDASVRMFTGQTFINALEKIAATAPQLHYPTAMPTEPHGDRDVSERPALSKAVDLLNYLWDYFHIHIRSWDEYFTTVLELARLGDYEVAHVLANDFLLKALQIIAADPILELPANYVRMLHNILRRSNSRPPSYVAILGLVDYLLQQLEPVLDPGSFVAAASERLDHHGGPFPWTSEECCFILMHPKHQSHSFLVEKLLAIDQAPSTVHSILGRLVATGGETDVGILETLCRNIQWDTTTQPMDPFIRAAGKYLECTKSLDRARRLIRHISGQAKSLQNGEGAAFLDFFAAALNLKRPDVETVRAIHDYCISVLPDWAPYLLVYADGGVRDDAEQLMDEEVFLYELDDVDEDALSLERKKSAIEVIRKLGMACLTYLCETHVRQRAQIRREAASTVTRVIGKCASLLNGEGETSEEVDVEFKTLHSEVMGSLRRLIIDEVDDDGSDWDGSYISSDPLDSGHLELGMQTASNEFYDTNLI